MWWFVAGGALVVAGALAALRAATHASGERASTVGGLSLALGASLAFWGLVAVVVGLVMTLG